MTASILYYYEEEKLARKHTILADGNEWVVYYEYTGEEQDGETVVKFKADGKTVTSHSKNDSFGRKVFDELQLGSGFVSRQFTYHAGEVTEEHAVNGKLKSTPTTQLISQIILSDGRTITYEYDAEERITKVVDSVEGTTEYTYDALGQLLTETKEDVVVNTMTYDNYGNILSKNGTVYVYGDSVWKDLLTGFDDQSITYDAQGNPISYLGHTLTWEKGRQLKSYDNISYTYNANGIRTSKTVDGVKHTYTLEGTKILQEAWEDNTLIPLYDNADEVCGIIYNNTPYYFLKNQQGDIISITDKNGNTVARYSYDAWGKCTVTLDHTIAQINPFRYRGYYYDDEIELYYVSSRYYDPEIGRFLNSDDASVLHFNTKANEYNLYSYCHNNPINNSDVGGYIIWNIIFNFVAGLLCGFVIQLFSDLVSYMFARLFKGKSATFVPQLGNYIGTMLDYAFDFISPFGGKKAKAVLQICAVLIPRVSKYGVKWLRKERITLSDILGEILDVLVSIIVSVFLGVKKKKEIMKIKKFPGAKNKKIYNVKVNSINVKYKKWGAKLDFIIPIPKFFINALLGAIFE